MRGKGLQSLSLCKRANIRPVLLCSHAQQAMRTGQGARRSRAPKIFESLLAQFRVAGGVLNGAMPEPILNCPRVMACIGQGVAAGMPQHVDVNLERKASALADALDQAIDGIGGEGLFIARCSLYPGFSSKPPSR